MVYSEFAQKLIDRGFTRIERDDRMLDVFPKEDREKGIELWEKYGGDKVHIIRVREPYNEKRAKLFELSREELEQLLNDNIVGTLDTYPVIKEGAEILQ